MNLFTTCRPRRPLGWLIALLFLAVCMFTSAAHATMQGTIKAGAIFCGYPSDLKEYIEAGHKADRNLLKHLIASGKCEQVSRSFEVSSYFGGQVISYVDGMCVARSDADCRASKGCGEHGRCIRKLDGCRAKTDVDCQRSEDCKRHGYCTARLDWCIPATDADCQRSDVCKTSGRCQLNERGRCI